MRVYNEQDASLLPLQDRLIAVLGYGRFGRPLALNLRDSGASVIIGNIADSYADDAQKDGFMVYPIAEATRQANIIYMAMPNEVMPTTYLNEIAPHLTTGDLLLFGSGYNLAYQMIEPPVFVDVGLITPRTMASNIRTAYVSGVGYQAYLCLHQRTTQEALERLLAVALASGALRQGALELNVAQEVTLDLFMQQALLPALHAVLLAAASALQDEGLPSEAILMELYLSGELSTFFNMGANLGLIATIEDLSLTGQYGLLTRTERFQETKMLYHMDAILEGIRHGHFAQEWADEFADGLPRLKRMRDKLKATTLWKLEETMLRMAEEAEESGEG